MKYTKQKLKNKLENKCSDLLTFHLVSHIEPELVVSKDLYIRDTINTISKMKQMLRDAQAEASFSLVRDFLARLCRG